MWVKSMGALAYVILSLLTPILGFRFIYFQEYLGGLEGCCRFGQMEYNR
jgi:hypothetical protein